MPRDKKVTSKIMSAIKSEGTKPEKALGKELWSRGLRYRKHDKTVYGKPDFVFKGVKVAVFTDGDFWHGHNWKLRGFKSLEDELATYSDFWVNKIRNNIKRDKKVNDRLKEKGWLVMRFWESDVLKNPKKYALKVSKEIKSRRGY